MAPGTHQGMLAFAHNDPALISPVQIPMTLTLETQTAAVELAAAYPEAEGPPGDVLLYTILVTNTGNGPDTFDLSVAGTWPVSLSAATTGLLQPGKGMEVTVSVTVPLTATEGDSDISTFTATSTFDDTVQESVTLTSSMAWLKLWLPVVIRQ